MSNPADARFQQLSVPFPGLRRAELLRIRATEPARIRAMFVDPNHARRGLGRRLLEASENAARAEGFSSTILLAMHSGIELYLACGYAPTEPYAFETPDGIELPCTVMTKRL